MLFLSALVGTYLDLYFVGKGLYTFPVRPLPEIFPINIAFTLVALPAVTYLILLICSMLNRVPKIGFFLLLGLFASVAERIAENLGLFIHHSSWNHLYSFVGYTVFFSVIDGFYRYKSKRT